MVAKFTDHYSKTIAALCRRLEALERGANLRQQDKDAEATASALDHAGLIAFALGREPWSTWLRKGGCLESAHCELSDLMLAVLARWGRPAAAPKPIPVSERMPEDADCLVIPPLGTSTFSLRYCWMGREIMHCGQARLLWDWKLVPYATDQRGAFKYWLPASTQFLPTTVDSDQPT